MKLLFIWHAAADPLNRPLFDELIAHPGVEAVVLTLPVVEDRQVRWRLRAPVRRRNARTGSTYRLVPGRAVRAASLGHHWYPGLPLLLRRFRPDLIHLASGEAAMAVAVETLVARRLFAPRARFVLHMVQNMRVDYRWPWPVLERRVLRGMDLGVAYSPGARRLLRSRGVRGEIPVRPFGVDPRLFSPGRSALRRRLGPGAPVIGWVGRMFLGKGLHVLLDASARMRRPHRLLIAGDGPQRAAVQVQADRLGLARRITWLPPRPPRAMTDVYRAFDIYTHPAISRPADMPAWKEQFARTLPEAMLTGLPVVGARSGEIPWVVGSGGLIVPERNPAALARALDRLVGSSSLRRRLGARGRARALAEFTFAAAARGLLAIWKRELARA